MKRMSLCAGLILLFSVATHVQAQQKNKGSKRTPGTQKVMAKSAKSRTSRTTVSNTRNLSSTGEYKAYSNTNLMESNSSAQAGRSLTITDPTIRTFNAIANGANIKIGSSGVIGVPKGRYGYANGHLTLLPNGATSSGTTTGSGSVGTGTSPGSIGTIGPGMGVNGRNPYAGPDIRGTRSRSYTDLLLPDSIRILPPRRQ
jgi:hypothetical protein